MTASLGSQTPVACGMASLMAGANSAWVGRSFAVSDGTEAGAVPDGWGDSDAAAGAAAGTSWGSGAGASQVCRYSVASNTSAQWPQRTQPSEIFNWSGTTLNIVPQAGQRVVKLMPRLLPASTRCPPARTWLQSSGASTFSGVARMLASTRSYSPSARSGRPAFSWA